MSKRSSRSRRPIDLIDVTSAEGAYVAGTDRNGYAAANGITPGMSHFSHISSIFAWKYS